MLRTIPMIAAFAASAALLGVTASPAEAQAPAYRAIPSVALAKADNVVAGDVLWRCGPGGCNATNVTARPQIVCAQVAKQVGRLESFTVAGSPLDADALAKCNAKAKGGNTALARN
ncbi:MAG: hypothetical protein H0X36_00370 [Sphingomonadaceae bacterium]|nr:hypothetical protein [Sphingomonadaceae bacterium]